MSIEYLNKICGNPYYAEPTIPYVGTNIPLSGSYIGQLIQVDNPAVPGGRSKMVWSRNALKYVTAAGEMLAGGFPPNSSSALVLLSPGTTNRVIVWQSAVIPDYLLPDGAEWTVSLYCGVQNAAPSGSGYGVVGAGISGSGLPVDDISNYPASGAILAQAPPNYGGVCGVGSGSGLQLRRGMDFRHPFSALRTQYTYQNYMGSYVPDANRLIVGVKLAQVDSQIRLDSVAAYSRGNL